MMTIATYNAVKLMTREQLIERASFFGLRRPEEHNTPDLVMLVQSFAAIHRDSVDSAARNAVLPQHGAHIAIDEEVQHGGDWV